LNSTDIINKVSQILVNIFNKLVYNPYLRIASELSKALPVDNQYTYLGSSPIYLIDLRTMNRVGIGGVVRVYGGRDPSNTWLSLHVETFNVPASFRGVYIMECDVTCHRQNGKIERYTSHAIISTYEDTSVLGLDSCEFHFDNIPVDVARIDEEIYGFKIF